MNVMAQRVQAWADHRRRKRSGKSGSIWFDCSTDGCNTTVGKSYLGDQPTNIDDQLVATAQSHGWTVTDDEALCRNCSEQDEAEPMPTGRAFLDRYARPELISRAW